MSRLLRKSYLMAARRKSDFDVVVPRRPSPGMRRVTTTVVICVGLLIAWILFARIPVTVAATGIVQPLGGVREIATFGDGLVTMQLRGKVDIRAGDILLKVGNPTREAQYRDARERFLATMRHAKAEYEATIQQFSQKLAAAAEREDSAGQAILQLQAIQKRLTTTQSALEKIEKRSLEAQSRDNSQISGKYEAMETGLAQLRRKGFISEEGYLNMQQRQLGARHSASQSEIQERRAEVESQKARREIQEVSEHLANKEVELLTIRHEMVDLRAQIDVTKRKLESQILTSSIELLEKERNQWLAANVVSPYDGKLVAINKAEGQAVRNGEPVAIINLISQNRHRIFAFSERVAKGRLRLRAEGREESLEVTPDTAARREALDAALKRLLPEAEFSVRACEGGHLIVESGEHVAERLAGVNMESEDLTDAEGVPVFAFTMAVGDAWKTSRLVTIVQVDSHNAKRIVPGARAIVQPDYEKDLVGAKLIATVRSVTDYVTTTIEAEAVIGSQELAKTVLSRMDNRTKKGDTTVILDFETGESGEPVWHGQPKRPIDIGTMATARIEVGRLAPYEIVIPLFAGIAR